jgi:hypothetical protein
MILEIQKFTTCLSADKFHTCTAECRILNKNKFATGNEPSGKFQSLKFQK